MEFEVLKREIQAGKFAPLYYFFGEESYFLDKLTGLLESKVLNPGEETFNKAVIYGNEAKAGRLMGELRSFPMMAEHRLVLLKEAQQMNKAELEKLVPYLKQPLQSTVFVIVFKGKKMDGRSKAFKAIKENGVIFESKSLYENQVSNWIGKFLKERDYTLEPSALQVLVAYLGNNLSLIESELEKIFIYLGPETKHIPLPVVYEMINVDKDFNVFELINALGVRDHSKSHFIINQMMKNVKDHPPILVVFQLFKFYQRLALLQSKKLARVDDIGRFLRIHKFIAGQYATALRNYNARDLQRNLVAVLEADLFLKGVHSTHMSGEHVMKTLVYKLLN